MFKKLHAFVYSIVIASYLVSSNETLSQQIEPDFQAGKSVGYSEYFRILQIRENSERELPDINFGGYRSANWGEFSENLDSQINVNAKSLGVNVTRFLNMSPDAGLTNVQWRILSRDMSIQLVLSSLIDTYGEPSARYIDGIVMWNGTKSILALRPVFSGAIITLRPKN